MKVLIAEDNRTSRNLYKLILEKWGYEVVAAANGREAWEAIRTNRIPIVISDWIMPEMDGLSLCREIRAAGLPHYVYVILLTAKKDILDIIAGMNAGADDYLVKPFISEELKVRILAGERIVNLEHRLMESTKKLEILATTDELSGLLNRREIMKRFDEIIAYGLRKRVQIGAMMLDIDHFKVCNDTYGHAAGDRAIKAVSNFIRQGVRVYDLVGRFGGEEFLCVFSEVDDASITKLAERLKNRIADAPIEVKENTFLTVTCSFGLALSNPDRGQTRDELISLADQAMYEAKSSGRNSICGPRK